MSNFKCKHPSLLTMLAVHHLLVIVLLLLNSYVGTCSNYKRIFSFGDSTMDTGNFVHLIGKSPSKYKEPPYGMTFFKHATGRMCDGRILIDFYAQALHLPLIPPNLPEQDSGLFPHGANFAMLGATAIPPDDDLRQGGLNATALCLGTQTELFEIMLERIAPADGARRKLIGESLFVMGGCNDYNALFHAGKSREEATLLIPDVVTSIDFYIEDLINTRGAKAFLIPNSFPLGCMLVYLSRFHSDNPLDYDRHGCLSWFNDFSQKHNEALRILISRLRNYNPGVKFIYADYYNAAMQIFKDPGRFGIQKPLVACCGGAGQYHTSAECNSTAKIWGAPGSFASWDGMHMTEKAYSVIAEGVLNGTFTDPPYWLN